MDYKNIDKEYMADFRKNKEAYEADYLSLEARVAASKALFRDQVVPYSYKPMFFTTGDVANFQELGGKILKIGDKVVDQYLKSQAFRDKFGFPKELEELILVDNGYGINVPMTRIDIFYDNREKFKFCEINTDGSSAMLEDNSFAEISMDSLGVKNLEEAYKFSFYELIHSWVKESLEIYSSWNSPKKQARPNVAILDLSESATSQEFKEFAQAYEEAGYTCKIVDPRELSYREGLLYSGDYRIDLVYRRLVTFEMLDKMDQMQDFIKAYKDQAFCCIGSFRSQLLHNKLIFKILHDDDTLALMTDEESKFIRDHVPDTGEFKGDKLVLDKLIHNKDSYIMKPSDMNVGQGVFVGRDMDPATWKAQLEKVFNTDYIYQEFIEPYNRPFLKYVDGGFQEEELNSIVGIFMYGGKFAGLYTRIGSENVITSVTSFRAANLIVSEK